MFCKDNISFCALTGMCFAPSCSKETFNIVLFTKHRRKISSDIFLVGMTGNVVIDNNGDREPDFWITDMNPETGAFVLMSELLNTDDGQQVSFQ